MANWVTVIIPEVKETTVNSVQEQLDIKVLDDDKEEVDTNISQLPCEHINFGCSRLLSLNQKLAHEAFCDFQPCKCPFPAQSNAECSWKGHPGQLLSHMVNCHKIITIFNGANATLRAVGVHVDDESDWFVLQRCYGQYFILILRKKLTSEGNTQYIAYAQLIGTRRQAQQYYYELELPGDCRSIKWQAKIRSLYAEDDSKEKSEYLMLDSSTAKLFIVNGTLIIRCSIRTKFM